MLTRREILKGVAAGGVAMAMGGRVRAGGVGAGAGMQKAGAVWASMWGGGMGVGYGCFGWIWRRGSCGMWGWRGR